MDYIVRNTVRNLLEEAMGSAGASPAVVGALADGLLVTGPVADRVQAVGKALSSVQHSARSAVE